MSRSKIGVNVDNLPAYELREQYPGSRDGEVKMFRKGEKGFVFKWSVASGTWIEIGEVIGTSNTKHVGDGRECEQRHCRWR